jgi:protein TonB
MTNGGFLQARKTKPIGLIAIVTGHAILLTAVALNPTRFGPRIDYIPKLIDTHRDDPPPPDQPPPKPHETLRETKPTRIDPLVDIGRPFGDTVPLTPLQPPPDSGPIGTVQPDPVFQQAVIDPRAAARFQPGYPSALVRAGIEGSATVRILIGSDGRVKTVELVTATDPAFFEATKAQALRSWRFLPATRDSAAVESWRTMTVKFKLQN